MPCVTTRDGTDLYVKDWGSGRPVILIHGWPLSADSWDAQAMALADAGYRAIAYDRRGFGRSAQPWAGYDYDTFSDDLADVMAATGATRDATLVGFSMGGGEVARYMSRHDGKGVIAAGLIASVVPYMRHAEDNPLGIPQEGLDGMQEAIRQDRPAFFREVFQSFFGVDAHPNLVSDDVLNWAWLMAMQAGLKPMIACTTAFVQTDFRDDLPAFHVPTLLVHGTGDVQVPIDISARKAAPAIAHSNLIEYEGAPHGLTVTHRERFTADLLAFLAG